ncbi:MAG: hypothetical protein ACOYYS_04765 [Chloroflexota bacterium]
MRETAIATSSSSPPGGIGLDGDEDGELGAFTGVQDGSVPPVSVMVQVFATSPVLVSRKGRCERLARAVQPGGCTGPCDAAGNRLPTSIESLLTGGTTTATCFRTGCILIAMMQPIV